MLRNWPDLAFIWLRRRFINLSPIHAARASVALFERAFNQPQRGNNKKRSAAIAMICGMTLLLSGCGIPDLRCPDPGPCMPPELNGSTSTENTSLMGTTEFFNDPKLSSLIDQALAGNQELKILYEDIQIAYNELQKRRGAYWPFFNLRAGADLHKPSEFTPLGAVEDQLDVLPGKGFPRPLPNFLVAAEVSWEVDIWRKLRNERDAEGLRYLGTADGRNYIVTRLVAEIAENYYTLIALDKQLETLDNTIALQEQSLQVSQALKQAGRSTELAVQRFQAEVRKNQSEKLIIRQSIIQAENRINFLTGRYPQHVDRISTDFIGLNLHTLSVGVPAQLLRNRPDIREAERELEAAGLDVRVARARFYPALNISAGVGYEAFNTRYLFTSPESLIYNVAGDLILPVINRKAIKADYLSANSRQLQSVYNYQRKILNAYTEVVNRINKAENYRNSIEVKKQQLQSLDASVVAASQLFQNARAEYMDVLFAQRDFNEAKMVLIETKKEQLSAIVNAYQALGGGWRVGMSPMPLPPVTPPQPPAEQVPAGPPVEELPPPEAEAPHA